MTKDQAVEVLSKMIPELRSYYFGILKTLINMTEEADWVEGIVTFPSDGAGCYAIHDNKIHPFSPVECYAVYVVLSHPCRLQIHVGPYTRTHPYQTITLRVCSHENTQLPKWDENPPPTLEELRRMEATIHPVIYDF